MTQIPCSKNMLQLLIDGGVLIALGGLPRRIMTIQPKKGWLLKSSDNFLNLPATISIDDGDVLGPPKTLLGLNKEFLTQFDGINCIKTTLHSLNHIAIIGSCLNEYLQIKIPGKHSYNFLLISMRGGQGATCFLPIVNLSFIYMVTINCAYFI